MAEALEFYGQFLRRPGRYLYVGLGDCPCCDPVGARDVLADALNRLPPSARRELRRVVARLDEEFLRRTLPDPRAAARSAWHAKAWWRQRLAGS
ncbi:hypothetical protein ACFYYR_08370 [Streptomyces sp. NPDC001922]|uniref:hypothetical protein n=1 Tax=Streptomyces sp. NPDC001922 TaxID=3364624 RepID=UPI0036CA190F